MSALRHGGPAFHSCTVNDSDVNATDEFGTLLPPSGMQEYGGMSLRDYFAAKAMPISAAIFESGQWAYIAEHAYQLADAMLKARDA